MTHASELNQKAKAILFRELGLVAGYTRYCIGTLIRIADACLVRLTEILPDPLLLTTDSGFKMDRRLGRRSPYECPGISGLAPPALRRIYPP